MLSRQKIHMTLTLSFLKLILLFYIYECLPECMSVHPWRSKEGIRSPELKLQTVMSYYVGASNWTWVSLKSSQCLTTEQSLQPASTSHFKQFHIYISAAFIVLTRMCKHHSYLFPSPFSKEQLCTLIKKYFNISLLSCSLFLCVNLAIPDAPCNGNYVNMSSSVWLISLRIMILRLPT